MGTSTFAEVRASIQAVGGEIPGLKTAYLYMPASQPTMGHIPAQYIYRVHPARHDWSYAEDTAIVYRPYELHYPVQAYALGDSNINEQFIEALFDNVLNTWYNRSDLPSLTYLQRFSITADGGLTRLPEYNGAFIGFSITVNIETLRTRENVV